MGCDCNKERDKALEYRTKDSLHRYMTKALTYAQPKSTNEASAFNAEVIRVITEPLAEIYSIDSFLREGRKSSLFTAKFKMTEQNCMLKFIEKAQGRARIQQKAKLSSEWTRLNHLDHPGILRTFEAMQDEKYFYLVSEPFAAVLQDHVTDNKFQKESLAAAIMFQLLRTLVYCHSNGFVHGRLSPKTLVLSDLTEKLKVKITGFGEFDSIPYENKQGEDAYRAPEISTGLNEKCDIWSCGVILSKLLSRRTPFKKPTTPRLRRCSTVFCPSVWSSKSEGAVALIAAMLHKNPADRPTAAECLAHPWVQGFVCPSPMKSAAVNLCLTELRKARKRNPLQEAVMKFAVLRMDKDVESLTAMFHHFDQDGDGKIGEGDLRRQMKAGEEEASQQIVEAADFEGGGAIGYTDFLISSLAERNLLASTVLQKVFNCFDRSNRGLVMLEDLKSAFFVRGSAEKERRWRELFLSAHTTENAEISFAGFANLVASPRI